MHFDVTTLDDVKADTNQTKRKSLAGLATLVGYTRALCPTRL